MDIKQFKEKRLRTEDDEHIYLDVRPFGEHEGDAIDFCLQDTLETRNDSRTKEDSSYLRAHLQDPFGGKYLAHAVETARYFSRNPTSAPGNNRMILSHILVRQEDTIPTSKESDSVHTATLLSDIFDKPLEERIRSRAYELYVQRGRRDNRAEQDWCEAEEELLANR